ncbi:MAG: hypothetical protein M3Y85_08845 [Bacteroidota bacterium]|nr:hypothetical protein [Bacteroidota bacterium]
MKKNSFLLVALLLLSLTHAFTQSNHFPDNGNVGIGTGSNSAPLALSVGTTTTNDGVRIGGSTYYLDIMANMNGVSYHPLVHPNDIGLIFKGSNLGSSGGLVIAPWSNSTGGFRMDNTGKIGIGTDPTAMMTFRSPQNVADDMQDAANYTISLRPDYNNGSSFTQGIAFGGNNSHTNHVSASIYHVQQGSPSYGDLAFATRPDGGSLAERLRISSTGYIGIGTPSPSSPLTVVNSENSSYVPVAEFYAPNNTTQGNVSQLRFGQSGINNNTAEFRFVYQGDGSTLNRTDFGYWGNPTPAFSYLANGNVGIGTTTPNGSLSIFKFEEPSLDMKYQHGGSYGHISIGQTSNFGGEMTLYSFGGNFNGTGPYRGYGSYIAGAYQGGLSIGASSSIGSLYFYSGGEGDANERMRITSTGNIGIGTATPQSKLSVNGTITTKKLKVTDTGWADYVFEKEYSLPTLQEVETYIKTNKHLPGVASAKEVEKEGLDVAENQVVLLKKIEEMTLYMIEMKKQIDDQQKKITQLEKQVNVNR